MTIKTIIILTTSLLSICNLFSEESSYIDKDPDVIHLIGENHHHRESIKLKKTLEENAANGNLILVEEGKTFTGELNSDCNCYGIEDFYLYSLTLTLNKYMDFALYKILQDISLFNRGSTIENTQILDFLKRGLANDFVFPSLSEYSQTSISKVIGLNKQMGIYLKNKEILEELWSLKKYATGDDPEIDLEKFMQIIENHTFENPFFLSLHNNIFHWLNLYKDVSNLCITGIIDLYADTQLSLHSINQVSGYMEKLQEYVEMDVATKYSMLPEIKDAYSTFRKFNRDEIGLNLRNQIFLKLIVSIFERNKWREKPFYVIIGAAHAPFIYEELKKWGYNVDLNDWAKADYVRDLISRGEKQLIDKKTLDEVIKFAIKHMSYDEEFILREALELFQKIFDAQLIDKESKEVYYFNALKNSIIEVETCANNKI